MNTQEAATKLETFRVKNQNYLKTQNLEDAFQTASIQIITGVSSGKLEKFNDSYIGTAIKWAKRNELKRLPDNTIGFDDLTNDSGEVVDVNEIFGCVDKGMESVVDNIDIEEKIEQMAAKDTKVKNVIKLFIDGYNVTEISEKVGISKSSVSRIVNMKSKQERKAKRKTIDKTNMEAFIKVMKSHKCKINKLCLRIGDLILHNDGKISSKENLFNGTLTRGWFLTYVDSVDINRFKEAVAQAIGN